MGGVIRMGGDIYTPNHPSPGELGTDDKLSTMALHQLKLRNSELLEVSPGVVLPVPLRLREHESPLFTLLHRESYCSGGQWRELKEQNTQKQTEFSNRLPRRRMEKLIYILFFTTQR